MIKKSFSSKSVNVAPKIETEFTRLLDQAKRPDSIKKSEWKKLSEYIRTHSHFWLSEPRPFKVKKDPESGSPRSILVIPANEEGREGVMLVFLSRDRNVLGKGGQRTVKRVFDVKRNDYIAYMPPEEQEKRLLKRLGNEEGVMCLIGLCHYRGKSGEPKERLFVKCYEGSLSNLIGVKMRTQDMNLLFEQLLNGLAALHKTKTRSGMRCFHKDIKPENILYAVSNEHQLEKAVLSDFGLANQIDHTGGTEHYYSPEHAHISLERSEGKRDPEKLKRFYRENGRALDCWALGITFLNLLRGDSYPGLKCLKATKKTRLATLANAKQEAIDEELSLLLEKVKNPERQKLCRIVIGLLKVDPKKRLSASKALKMLNDH